MLRWLGVISGLLAALLLATAPAVLGHTQFVEMIPADEAVLDVSPPQVIVVFNDAIQEDRSSVVVLDLDGNTVAEGGLDPADAARLVADLPPLEGGRYLVRYTAYSADNELLRDQLEFEVTVAATPAPTPTPTAAPTAPPTAKPTAAPGSPEPTAAATPTPSTAPDEDATEGTDAVQVLIPLVLGGAIVAVVAFALLRRRQP